MDFLTSTFDPYTFSFTFLTFYLHFHQNLSWHFRIFPVFVVSLKPSSTSWDPASRNKKSSSVCGGRLTGSEAVGDHMISCRTLCVCVWCSRRPAVCLMSRQSHRPGRCTPALMWTRSAPWRRPSASWSVSTPIISCCCSHETLLVSSEREDVRQQITLRLCCTKQEMKQYQSV